MSRTTLYVIKEITSSFLFISIILTSIAWLSQALRYLELFTSENILASDYLFYILLLIPKIINLTIPISFFIAVIFTLNRMRSDSELIIFWSAGKSNRNILISPILLIASFLFIIVLLLNIQIIPKTSLELRNKITEIRSSGVNYNILKEKKFINPVNNLTIFIQEIDENNFSGLMIQDNKDQLKPITYISEDGEFRKVDSKSFLVLYNGFMQIYNSRINEISEIQFESYELDLTPYHQESIKDIYPEERSTNELIKRVSLNEFSPEEFGVLHNRFIAPIYIFIFGFLPLLTFKMVRRPDSKWTIPLVVISVAALCIKFFEITLASLLLGNNSLLFISYMSPILIFLFLTIVLFIEKSSSHRSIIS